jgi:hypothetical protein
VRILALSWFDPASVVLSHRDLMQADGHDFRLAVVRAYTERQQQADYVCERLIRRVEDVAPGVSKTQVYWEKLSPNLESLQEFTAQADVIQFHPGIGHGDGDWASREDLAPSPGLEGVKVARHFDPHFSTRPNQSIVHFIHGSRSTWVSLDAYRPAFRAWRDHPGGFAVAASTIDYATELDAAYLPPLVDVGTEYLYGAIDPSGKILGTFSTRQEAEKAFPGKGVIEQPIPRRARLRGDDDPLLVAHTPTDRVACSTEEFLKAAQGLGIPVRLGEGIPHSDVLRLKAECNAGFDHLRGAFSVNTLENAALGLVPLFAFNLRYADRQDKEGLDRPQPYLIENARDLRSVMGMLAERPDMTRDVQRAARSWWETHFSAGPITKRLVQFYKSL